MQVKIVTTANLDSPGRTYMVELDHQEFKTPEALLTTAHQVGYMRLSWENQCVLIPWEQIRFVSYDPSIANHPRPSIDPGQPAAHEQ